MTNLLLTTGDGIKLREFLKANLLLLNMKLSLKRKMELFAYFVELVTQLLFLQNCLNSL